MDDETELMICNVQDEKRKISKVQMRKCSRSENTICLFILFRKKKKKITRGKKCIQIDFELLVNLLFAVVRKYVYSIPN